MKGDSSCEDANANFARITRHQRSSKSPICRLVVRELSARPQCPTMNALKSCAVVGLLTTVVFAQELSWSELARRPELWPAQCTAKEKMTFDGGVTVQAGQKLSVLKVTADEVQVTTADGRTTFTAEPKETDVLPVAQAAYAKLTPKQRALSYQALTTKKELWPQRVTLNRTFDMGGGRVVREGEQLTLEDVQADRLVVIAESVKARFQVVPQATDVMALSWKLVEDDKAMPRFVDAQKEKQQQVAARQEQQDAAQQKRQKLGPVIAELEPELVSSVTGKPAPLDENALPRYIVLFRGSSTCPITRQFAPTLIKYYRQMKPTHPEFEIVYLMTESAEDTGKFAKELGFSWRAIPYEQKHPMPTVMQPIGSLLPQLVVMDRNGRVLANGLQNSAPNALKQLDALLRAPVRP